MNFQWLVNETMSFGIWLALGVILPALIFILSIWALSQRGYKLRPHTPHQHSAAARSVSGRAAPDPAERNSDHLAATSTDARAHRGPHG